MTHREVITHLKFRPTAMNLLVAACGAAWVIALGAALVHLMGHSRPQAVELTAVAGDKRVSPQRLMVQSVVEPMAMPIMDEPLGLDVAAVSVVEDSVVSPVEPMVEILEVIERPEPQQVEGDVSEWHGPMFDGRPLRKVRTIRMLVTAYSPDERSCGIWADGITASGYSVWTNGMALVAADTRILPFHSIVTVPGYNEGRPVPVLDRGGAIKGNRLDLLMPTHEIALQWGAQRLDVDVWDYAD